MRNSLNFARFFLSEFILLVGAWAALQEGLIGTVVTWLCVITFTLPLENVSGMVKSATRPIVGKEAFWSILAIVLILGAWLFYAAWNAGSVHSLAAWSPPTWLAALFWLLLAAGPVLWLVKETSRNWAQLFNQADR
jgi:hypothetical protein